MFSQGLKYRCLYCEKLKDTFTCMKTNSFWVFLCDGIFIDFFNLFLLFLLLVLIHNQTQLLEMAA